MRKTYSADFKAKVALESVKGDKSLAELAAKYEVHPTQIGQWRKVLLSGLSEVFSDKRQKQEENTEEEKAGALRLRI